MGRPLAIAAFIIFALALPVAVFADSKVDPHSSSPAGAVYEIPLQTARGFGSPGGGAQAGGGSGGGGTLPQGSAIKSENGYGSSSRIPGLAASVASSKGSTATGSAASGAKAAAAVATASSATGSGGTSASGGKSAAPRIDTRATSSESPSLAGTYGLVILIVLGGAAAGVAAATAARRAQS